MKLDTILGIAAFAVGLVSLFALPKARRLKLIICSFASILILLTAYKVFLVKSEEAAVRRIEDDIIEKLRANGPLPFDELYTRLYPCDYGSANDALDTLIGEHRITDELIDVKSGDGNSYRVKRYKVAVR
jgi:hypothetical protein